MAPRTFEASVVADHARRRLEGSLQDVDTRLLITVGNGQALEDLNMTRTEFSAKNQEQCDGVKAKAGICQLALVIFSCTEHMRELKIVLFE